jgi:hypothetical protein
MKKLILISILFYLFIALVFQFYENSSVANYASSDSITYIDENGFLIKNITPRCTRFA